MQKKQFVQGTHRAVHPRDTLEKVTPFLKEMGITRVANLTGLDHIGIPVYAACRPNSQSLSVSQGKGHCHDSAKISAIMESIEGYHAENILLPVLRKSYVEMLQEGHRVVSLERITKSCERDFDVTYPVRWTVCNRIGFGESVWLPYEVISAAFTVPEADDHGFFIADSNGLASGNTITEAVNHALYEVIERDCLALWQLTPSELQDQKRIDMDTVDEPFLLQTLSTLRNKNIHIAVWNITNDLGIPTFICKLISENNTGVRPAYGSGTHLNKNIALSRAITEAAQSRLTFIAGARDDQYHEIYEAEISEKVYSSWLEELKNTNGLSLTSFQDIPFIHFDYLDEDQQYILSRLNHAGLTEAFYADLTREEFGISVVKVVVPGLEGVTYPDRRLLGQRALEYYDQYGVGACEMI